MAACSACHASSLREHGISCYLPLAAFTRMGRLRKAMITGGQRYRASNCARPYGVRPLRLPAPLPSSSSASVPMADSSMPGTRGLSVFGGKTLPAIRQADPGKRRHPFSEEIPADMVLTFS